MRLLKKISGCVLCIMITVLMTGCSLTELIAGLVSGGGVTELKAPIITLLEDKEAISWTPVDNADYYYVFKNNDNTPCGQVETSGSSSYVYKFTSNLSQAGAYTFYVIATSENSKYADSKESNVVSFNHKPRLQSPRISIDRDTKVLSWTEIENASSYEIYLNNEPILEVVPSITNYNFTSKIIDFGLYKFSVVAKGDGVTYKDSRQSDTQRYISSSLDLVYDVPTDTFVYTENEKEPSFTLNDTMLTWESVSDASEYTVVVYNNDMEYISTDTVETSIDIADMLLVDGVYVVRVGSNIADSLYMSEAKYYNTRSQGVYTEKQRIYAFDGQVNDYYIEDYEELTNIIYYQFINRNEDFTIKLSDSYLAEINLDSRYMYKRNNNGVQTSTKITKILDKVNLVLEDAFNSFMETCYYNYGVGDTFASSVSESEYRVRLNFYGVYECDPTIDAITIYEQEKYVPYYETYVGTKRSATYDDFVSDRQFVTTHVTTSEQLFWAVTYGYTPLFTTSNSRAKIIYDMAKDVLRNIIYEEMTDYEKALAIFDWISINTNYDHSEYNNYGAGYVEGQQGYYYTEHACFYLEGVFMTGNSVCDGFAKAFALMCNMEGIDCVRIVGSVRSGLHAWNKVKIDDKWYVVDITWTEASDPVRVTETLFHSYFLVSDAYISNTHADYIYRESYEKYPANNMYNHFGNHYFGGYDNNPIYDHVITSDEELEKVLDYVMQNSVEHFEIIFDCKTYITRTSMEDPSIQEMIYAKLRKCKFASQYLHCVNWSSLTMYSDNAAGLIFNIGATLLIDSIEVTPPSGTDLGTLNEVDNLVDYAVEKNLQGKYELYVVKEILDAFMEPGMTITEAFEAMVQALKDQDDTFDYTLTTLADTAIEYDTDMYAYYFDIEINHGL